MDQKRRVAVWCEAQGMVAQLVRVAEPYGVHVVSGGGFDSVTDKYAFARLVADAAQPFDVLHIGDLDQAGESIFTVVSEDVPAFADAMRGDVTFTRLAITEEQVKLYDLPHVPGERPVVQAEALPPDTLAALVRSAIEAHLDLKKKAAVERRTKKIRAATLKALQGAGLVPPSPEQSA